MLNVSPTNEPGYFNVYINQVPEKDLSTAFANQLEVMPGLFRAIDEERSNYAYAPGKWTLKEVLQHLIDAERIFSYRALCFSRREQATLPSFDENIYAANSSAANRTWASLVDEMVSLRQCTTLLFNSFNTEMLAAAGRAGIHYLSVEQLGFVTVGHFTHHKNIIEERYLQEYIP